MARAAKTAKAKVAAKRPATRKPAQRRSAKLSVAQRLNEALEQQMATSDILRAISRSQTDAQPVFDTIAAHAMKLCESGSATVATFDGELIHLAALAVVDPQGADAVRKLYPRPPSRDITASRSILTAS